MRLILPLILPLLLGACAGGSLTAHSIGLDDGALTECPPPPRCKSSQMETPRHGIAPLRLSAEAQADPAGAFTRAVDTLAGMPRTRLITRGAGYAHAEVDSPWGMYIDDVELLLDAPAGRIHVRSSGRIGYYDFQVNRDRIETLRGMLIEAGLVMAES